MIASRLNYAERAKQCKSPLAKKLLQLLETKKTNLALSADVTSSDQLLQLANQLGPDICVLKTHIDILTDFTPALTQELRRLATAHQFLLFEDRKFADIGNTVKQQYAGGIYHIADWADIINAHALPGPGLIQGLAAASHPHQHGLLLIAEMSSAGHLMDAAYRQKTLALAKQFPDFVIGFITQHALSPDPEWINMTPGIQLETGTDALGQQYLTPEKAVVTNGADIIIVGRGIIAANDPKAVARIYRERGWQAYQKRVQ